MKRKAVVLLALLLVLASNAWAKTIRVKFPPGRTTVVLKGRTTGGPSESGVRARVTAWTDLWRKVLWI